MRAAALLALAVCGLAAAQTGAPQRLDHSGSPRPRVHAPMEWAYSLRGSGGDPERLHQMQAQVPGVEVRLDTRAYRGQRVMIHIGLEEPVQGLLSTHSLELRWQGRGRFSPGRLVPGQRSPLFAGVVDQDELADILDFHITFDDRDRDGAIQLEFYYDIEPR
jgi:hypothetical protein